MVAAEIGVALVERAGDDVTLVLTPSPKPRPAVARRPKLSIHLSIYAALSLRPTRALS
jgi:hypothetical protein